MDLKGMGLVPLIIDIDDDIIKPLFAKEGDYRSRGISLQILDKGKEIDTTGIIVEFFAKPRDGKVYVVEATPVDTTKGKYEIVYPSSILQPGIVKCEIRLVKMTDDEIDEIITTKSFNLKVYETIADEDIFEGIDIEPIVEILVQAARNEEERIAAENERIQAENARKSSENTRELNEQTRIQNENIRQSNEQTRQQNEAIRQQNEQDRIGLYNALKDLDVSQYELRLQNVENQVNIDNFLLEEWDEPVIPLPSNATNGQINEINIFGNTEAEENNVKSTICAIRLKSVNEDETKESTLYILGRDKEGNILELRSLPNGTKDEINVAERKLIKRIGEKANVSSGTVINYTDMAEGGTYFAWNENGETETGTKGDTLGIDATVLIYQLAEPKFIPVEVFGNLQSYENGTVYVETIIPRVDFYTSEGVYLENEPPIKEIDALYLVDKETGVLTSLDISKAFIFPYGKGFTHPDSYNDALVYWDYIPDVESTNPAISMKLPTNLKASVTSALEGVQELSNKTKKLDTRVIANRRDIETLYESLFSHEEKSVIDAGGVHGLEIESGTFTPVLYGSNKAGSHTYERQLGYYYRIGKLVHIDITIQINAGDLDTNMSGNLRIGGLPFVNAVGTNRNVGLAKGRISNFKYDNYEEILFFVVSNNNYIQIVGVRNGNTLFPITNNNLATTTTVIELSGTYVIV